MLANGLVSFKRHEIFVHIRDIVKITDRAQYSVQVANELGIDDDSVL